MSCFIFQNFHLIVLFSSLELKKYYKESCIQETQTLLVSADRSTNTMKYQVIDIFLNF